MVKGSTFIDDWIAEGEARGEARGQAHGEAQGEKKQAHIMTLRILRKRFGELSPAVIARIESGEPDWCQRLIDAALEADTLSEIDMERI